jgi:hypothetical protein
MTQTSSSAVFGAWCVFLLSCGGQTQGKTVDVGGAGDALEAGVAPGELPPTPVERDQFIPLLVTTFCDRVAQCCQTAGLAYDGALCRETVEPSLSARLGSTPAAHYDSIVAGRCRDAYASSLRDCENVNLRSFVGVCNDVFTGDLPAGASCTQNSDCARPAQGSAYCIFTFLTAAGGTGSPMGICSVDAQHAKAGERCSGICPLGTFGGCAQSDPAFKLCYEQDGLFCSYDSTTDSLSCKPIARVGEKCMIVGCAAGAFCEAGICTPQHETGSCGMNLDACSANSYCDMTYFTEGAAPASQCLPKQSIGGRCAGPIQCLSGECDEGPPTDPTNGVCVKRPVVTPEACAGKPE